EAWQAAANHCRIKASRTPNELIDIVNRLRAATTRTPALTGPDLKTAPAPDSQPASNSEEDRAFQTELRQKFLSAGSEHIALLRGLLQAFVKSEIDADRVPRLFALYRKLHSLTSNSA